MMQWIIQKAGQCCAALLGAPSGYFLTRVRPGKAWFTWSSTMTVVKISGANVLLRSHEPKQLIFWVPQELVDFDKLPIEGEAQVVRIPYWLAGEKGLV